MKMLLVIWIFIAGLLQYLVHASPLSDVTDSDLVNLILDNSTDFKEQTSDPLVSSDYSNLDNSSSKDCNSVDCSQRLNLTNSSRTVTTPKILWNLVSYPKNFTHSLDRSDSVEVEHSTQSSTVFSDSDHSIVQNTNTPSNDNELDSEVEFENIDYVLHYNENMTDYISSLGNDVNENLSSTVSAFINPDTVNVTHNMEATGDFVDWDFNETSNVSENTTEVFISNVTNVPVEKFDFITHFFSASYNSDLNPEAFSQNLSIHSTESNYEPDFTSNSSTVTDSVESKTFESIVNTTEVPQTVKQYHENETSYLNFTDFDKALESTVESFVTADDMIVTNISNLDSNAGDTFQLYSEIAENFSPNISNTELVSTTEMFLSTHNFTDNLPTTAIVDEYHTDSKIPIHEVSDENIIQNTEMPEENNHSYTTHMDSFDDTILTTSISTPFVQHGLSPSSQENYASTGDSVNLVETSINTDNRISTNDLESLSNASQSRSSHDIPFSEIIIQSSTPGAPTETEVVSSNSSNAIIIREKPHVDLNTVEVYQSTSKAIPSKNTQYTDSSVETSYHETIPTTYDTISLEKEFSSMVTETSLPTDRSEEASTAAKKLNMEEETHNVIDSAEDSSTNYPITESTGVSHTEMEIPYSSAEDVPSSVHHINYKEENKISTNVYTFADTFVTEKAEDAAYSVDSHTDTTSTKSLFLDTITLEASLSEDKVTVSHTHFVDVSTIATSETHREGKHIPFSSTPSRSTTVHQPTQYVTADSFSSYLQPTVTEKNYGYLVYNRVKLEDLAPDEKSNMIKGFITLPYRTYTDEELNDKILIIHLWLLHAIADEYKNATLNVPGPSNNEDEIEFDNLPQILYIEPTPEIEIPHITLTFIVNNKWRNVTYPVDLVITILKLHSEDLKHLVEIEEIYFSHYFTVENHDLISIIIEKYGIVLLSTCIITVAMILFLICVVIYYRRKNRHSAHSLTDDKLHRNMQEAMGIDLNPAVIILQDEIREKAALNGNKISSLDDDEGWLAPIDDVPVAEDNNAPFVQDTKL